MLLLLLKLAQLTCTSRSCVTGPARVLYLAPLGSRSTAAAPGASPGTIFTTAQVLLILSKSAGLLPTPYAAARACDAADVAAPPCRPLAVKARMGVTVMGVKQGLTVTLRLPAPGPATFKALASCASSTG